MTAKIIRLTIERGGKRRGAYKPAAMKKNPCPLKLEQYLIDWMNEQDESKAVLIARALIETYQIEPPAKIPVKPFRK